jgi:hypothetical protein
VTTKKQLFFVLPPARMVQDAINLFLGNFVPDKPGQPELWDLETDVYLHAAAGGSAVRHA